MAELALTSGITPIKEEHLPTGWRARQLLEFCAFIQGGRLGLTKQDHYRTSGTPAFSAAGQDGFVGVAEFRGIDAVVLSAIGANCGRCFLATGEWTMLANVQAIVPNVAEANARFLHYRMNRDDYWPRSGSAQPFIKPSDMKWCWIALPPISEQFAVSEVLRIVDTAILETEAIIGKLKAVKQGLLHDLLTRGIDGNGVLRSPHSEAPHLYKESPLGWIPNEWDTRVLCEVLSGIDAGWSPSCPEEPPSAGEWGVLKVSAISSGRYNPLESKRLPHYLKPKPSIEVKVGDVLLARANGVADLVATTVLVKETQPGLMLSDKTLRLVPNVNRLMPRHLTRVMGHVSTRRQVGGMLNGSSGQKNISQSQIFNLRVCLPSIVEQRRGDNHMAELDERMESTARELAKLRNLKAGLMDDLLTGRVRVTPILEKPAQIIAEASA